MIFFKKNKKAFTLIELIVSISIILLIASLAIVSYSQIRKNSRDSKRIADINEIRLALENYKLFEGTYPSQLLPGQSLIGVQSSQVYLDKIPENPAYYGYDCISSDYQYVYVASDDSYKLSFCLESGFDIFSSGEKCVLPTGIIEVPCPQGIYTPGQITNLIQNDLYIPIANADELSRLSSSTSQIMGLGTQWEASYQTGLDKKYVQINHIDLSGYQSGSGWLPIGNLANPFVGIYDGNGLKIRNAKINRSTTDYVALFGVISNSLLQNIILENFQIIGKSYVSSLVGMVTNSNIYNVNSINVTVRTNTTGDLVIGGLIASIRNSNIENCFVYNADVRAVGSQAWTLEAVGGIIGLINEASDLSTNSIVRKIGIYEGYVYAGDTNRHGRYIGGAIGGMTYAGEVYDSFNLGVNVRGGGNTVAGVGGFVGMMRLGSPKIFNSYAVSVVIKTATPITIGGFCGYRVNGTITNSYYDKDVSALTDNTKGLPRSSTQMKEGFENSNIGGENIYTNWSPEIWIFSPSSEYPRLNN